MPEPNKQDLIQYFKEILAMGSERAVADLAVNAIGHDAKRFNVLLEMCFTEKYPLCMRSARALQLYCEQDVSYLLNDLDIIIERSLLSDVEGVRRNFLKIFNEFVDFSLLSQSGFLLSKCFEFVMNPSEKPGIRVHSLQILFKYAMMEKDIAKELQQVIDFLEDEFDPSFKLCTSIVSKKLKASQKLD